MTASLLLAGVTASAQSELLEALPEMLQKEFSIEPKKSLNQERDVLKEGCPLKSRCDIYSFTLTKKQQEKVFKGLKDCFESAGKDKNCYSVNSMNDLTGKESLRNLIIGDDVQHYVTIGQDYTNYINVNILDAKDTTKTHRYAYALEWRETSETSEKGAIDVRYIITYAKTPTSPNSSLEVIKKSNKDAIESYIQGFIKGLDPKNVYRIKNARFQWNGKDYPIEKIDSVFRDAEKRGEQISKNLQKAFIKGNSVVVWADSIDHDNDPVTDVVLRLQQGENVTFNDLLCNDNILLILSQLKQQYLAGQNTEFNAISIYTLCRKAYDGGFFSDSQSFEELEQIICEVDKLTEKAKTETDRKYFQMAREQLDKILKSRK